MTKSTFLSPHIKHHFSKNKNNDSENKNHENSLGNKQTCINICGTLMRMWEKEQRKKMQRDEKYLNI